MSPGTQMMVHGSSACAGAPPPTMRKAADVLDKIAPMASIYAEAAGGTDRRLARAHAEDTWYTAEEAVEAGLADEVAVVPDAGQTSTAGARAGGRRGRRPPRRRRPRGPDPMYRHAGRSHSGPRPASPRPRPRTGHHPTQEGSPAVAFSDEQVTTMRQKLGVAEDADEATILAALDEALDEQTDRARLHLPAGPRGHDARRQRRARRAPRGRRGRPRRPRQLDAQARDAAITARSAGQDHAGPPRALGQVLGGRRRGHQGAARLARARPGRPDRRARHRRRARRGRASTTRPPSSWTPTAPASACRRGRSQWVTTSRTTSRGTTSPWC
jgi:hypothetical protein